MRLFQIDEKIEAIIHESVDPETGELSEETLAALDELEEDREKKALAIAGYLKGERCEGEAVKAVAKQLMERAARHERRAAKLEEHLAGHVPQGQGYRDARSEIVWRKSTAVEVLEEGQLPPEYMRHKPAPPPQPDKIKIKASIQSGNDVPGARLKARSKLVVR